MNKWLKATETEKVSYLCSRWEELKRIRAPYLNRWQEISKYISPFSGKFNIKEHNQTRSSKYILDGEAGYDVDILASGLMAGASSPARPWFTLQPTNQQLLSSYDVVNYCDTVQKILLKVFSSTNTYNTLQSMYKELALFGISADLVYEDNNQGIKHHLLQAGEYCVATNSDGDIDTLYRNFELSTKQAVNAFGYDNCPDEIKRAHDQCLLEDYWEFIHAIEPREDRDPTSSSNKNMPWASYYVSISTKPTIVKESGFNYFPVICPRWNVFGTDAYGESPAMVCLPDIKQLQLETLRKAELIEQYTKPPLQVPINSRQNTISLKAGAVNYVRSTTDNSIKPILQSTGDLNAIRQDIAELKASIRRHLFYDLFMMVNNGTESSRRTTVEIYALQNEQMLSLGAVVERNQNECLGKLVNITYQILGQLDMLPPPTEDMQDEKIEIEFTSVLAQSQKSVDINGIDRFFSAISMAGQIAPEVFDRINPDGYVDEYRERIGVSPKVLRSKEEADQIRQQRAQAQQQHQEQEQNYQQAMTANQLAQAQQQGANAGLAMQQLDDVGGGDLY